MRVGGQLHILASSSFEMSRRCTLDKGLGGPQGRYSCYKGEKVYPPAGNRSSIPLPFNLQCIQYTDEQSRLRVLVNLPKLSTLSKLCGVKWNGSGS
jgi:hypothetical protein